MLVLLNYCLLMQLLSMNHSSKKFFADGAICRMIHLTESETYNYVSLVSRQQWNEAVCSLQHESHSNHTTHCSNYRSGFSKSKTSRSIPRHESIQWDPKEIRDPFQESLQWQRPLYGPLLPLRNVTSLFGVRSFMLFFVAANCALPLTTRYEDSCSILFGPYDLI